MADKIEVPKGFTQEQLDRAMGLLQKEDDRKERIAKGEIKGSYYKPVSEMTPDEAKQHRTTNALRRIKERLVLDKAEAAKITASSDEIQAEFTRRYPNGI